MLTGNDNADPTNTEQSSSSGTTLRELKAQRSSTKGSISRIKKLVEHNQNLSLYELECRLGILESYTKQLFAIQSAIDRLDPENEKNSEARSEFEDLYCSAKGHILSLISTLKKKDQPACDAANTSIVLPSMSGVGYLPQIKLPNFSGKFTEYTNFINTFDILVHADKELSDVAKLQHLRTCLGGQALELIKNLEVTAVNYTRARKLLDNRYNNKCIILQAHIKAIFDIQKINKCSAFTLRSLADSFNSHLYAMKSIGNSQDILNSVLINLGLERLDPDTRGKWEESLSLNAFPNWEEFTAFVNKRSQVLENKEINSNSNNQMYSYNDKVPKSKFNANRSHKVTSAALTVTQVKCEFCQQFDHNIYQCKSFCELPIMSRFEQVKKLGLCINCLTKGHRVKACRSGKCRVCSLSHHSLLHRYSSSSPSSSSPTTSSSLQTTPDSSPQSIFPTCNPSTSLHSSVPLKDESQPPVQQVILATAIVEIKDNAGNFIPARALLDSASQLNFLTENLVQKLNLKRQRIEGEINGIGDSCAKVRFKTDAIIRSRVKDFSYCLEAWILPCITTVQPERKINTHDWEIPSDIPLADSYFNVPGKIDILLGAATFFDMMIEGQLRLKDGLPTIKNTVFGWIVSGSYRTSNSYHKVCNLVSSELERPDYSLNRALEQLWEIEHLHDQPNKLTQEQQDCEDQFLHTVRRNEDGRFIVKLPFKEPGSALGSSHETAKSRFYSLERKLEQQQALKNQYVSFMREYEQLGHMQEIKPQDMSLVRFVLPHQFVLRPDSSSTKLRVVFDGSSPSTSGKSLNDILMIGPTVQPDLFSIVLRFRRHKFALTADITKMYRQILVKPEDSYYQCILWRESPSEQLKMYRLTTVTYGTSSAPFHATRCLTYLADNNPDLALGAYVIRNCFYVDDLIAGSDTREKIVKIQHEVETILAQAKFCLRKWYSNDPKFLDRISITNRETPLRINDSDVIKALGIIWEPKTDCFHFIYSPKELPDRITKRTVLSDVSQLFDPLGLINPVTVLAKIFIQELWLRKLEWDEQLPDDLSEKWKLYRNQLYNLQKIRIPRYILSSNIHAAVELHGYADASERAYGCCIYSRCMDTSGKFVVNLVCAKSRVAPVKTVSLPRLELAAAHLLVNLLERVKPTFDGRLHHIFLWSDSSIVLHWVQQHASNWTTYVANRVSQIQGTLIKLEPYSWKHIRSRLNQADIISRGASVDEIIQSPWFTGPDYLYSPYDEWPVSSISFSSDEPIPEKRKIKTVLVVDKNKQVDAISLCKYVNNFGAIRRIFAYVVRYLQNLKEVVSSKRDARPPNRSTGNLTAKELEGGFMVIVYIVQRSAFIEDLSRLEKGGEVCRTSTIRSLNPFIDRNSKRELLRVGGRLQNANLPFDATHPILLPKDHIFVTTFVNHLHVKLLHAGTQALVAAIRDRFWIVNARDIARKVVHKCIHCFKYKPKLSRQIMGNLPKHRTQPTRPFLHAGVDFCGPIMTTYKVRGKLPLKTYIAVFVCFSTKACHLEVASDLSTETFIGALKRFISRRGTCAHLYCDNATNFVGAKKQLAELRKQFYSQQMQLQIGDLCAENGITFHHIPPRAPHFGGLWESIVKLAKHHLLRTLSQALLTYEEINTIVAQIEAIVNSRPMTPLSTDPNDEEALTPGHFLIGERLTALPDPDVSEYKLSSLSRWQRISALRQHFWKRWSREYVLNLQNRFRWHASSPNVKVGALVLLAEDNLPPQKWITGRITEVITGNDGKVRVAVIKTKQGSFKRAVHKLAPLPLDD